MLSHLCVTLTLMAGFNTFPGADIQAEKGVVHAQIHNIVGLSAGPAVSLSSRACYQDRMHLDAEDLYNKMSKEQKAQVVQGILHTP